MPCAMPYIRYPSSLDAKFMGARIPSESSGYQIKPRDYFNNYRNEKIARMQCPPYEIGETRKAEYYPHSNAPLNKDYLRLPQPMVSMLDPGRQQEVDNFYIACQLHREQIKDHSHSVHPMAYFKKDRIKYQNPDDPTSAYLKYPERYVKYKSPQVLPLTSGRSYPSPNLPERALTGVYNPSSCVAYKR